MKHLLFSLLFLCCLSAKSQVIVQSGLGIATSGFVHPVSEVDAGWAFKPTAEGHVYQATMGWQFNPYIDKTIYTVKGGVSLKSWTLKAGVGLVNRSYNVSRYVGQYPADGYYTTDTYVNAYNILVLGAERYIDKWAGDHHKIYYGVDLVDGDFYGKIGFRFQYKINR